MANNPIYEFETFLQREYQPSKPLSVIADGKVKRFATKDDTDNSKAGWYAFHETAEISIGLHGDWRRGQETNVWTSVSEKAMTDDMRKKRNAILQENQKNYLEERTKKAKEAADWAGRIIPISRAASSNNAYLKRKQVPSYGLKEYKGVLQVPVYKKDRLIGVQFINPDGGKYFKAGTDVQDGAYFPIGKIEDTVVIAEGYATGASIHQHTGLPVRLAFQAGNLKGLGIATREEYPEAKIIFAADNDIFGSRYDKEGNLINRGVLDSTQAAKLVNGSVIIPKFPGLDFDFMKEHKVKDFNDLSVYIGQEELTKQFKEFGLTITHQNTHELPTKAVTNEETSVSVSKLDHRQMVTDKIIEMLEKGVAPWQKPWNPELPISYNGRHYRGGNAIYLNAIATEKGYTDPRWITFKQAQEQGWKVKKGEKATRIEFWQFSKKEKSPDGSEIEVQLEKPIVRYYSVFNGNQVEGMPEYKRAEFTTDEITLKAEQVLIESGAKIQHKMGDKAFYSPIKDEITVPLKNQFKSSIDYYSVATHELAHWTGHESRLNRDLSGQFGSESYAREELRAEIASMLIQSELGIPHNTNNHTAYIDSWIKALQSDKNEIFRASKDAEKISDYIRSFSFVKDKTVESKIDNQASLAKPLPIAEYKPSTKTLHR